MEEDGLICPHQGGVGHQHEVVCLHNRTDGVAVRLVFRLAGHPTLAVICTHFAISVSHNILVNTCQAWTQASLPMGNTEDPSAYTDTTMGNTDHATAHDD